jgi:serine/threonine protein kinase
MFLFTSGINKFYDVHETLGSGSFAVVKRATNKKTGEEVAVKIIDKKVVGSDVQDSLQTEIDILQRVNHPNVIGLKEIFDSSKKLYLVMDLVTGGELFDRIVAKGHYSERDAADLTVKVTQAVQYLHSIGVVHRDLKPENLLYASPADNAEIKVADFGLAKIVSDSQVMVTTCGTPGYVAPEVLQNKGYDAQVDVWSIGVILYILLCGFPPFYEESTPLLFEQIMKGEFDFPSPYWDPISDDAKDLIRKMLVVDPKARLTCDQVMQHKWIQSASSVPLSNTQAKLREFNAKRKLKQAMLGVMAANKLNLLKAVGKK